MTPPFYEPECFPPAEKKPRERTVAERQKSLALVADVLVTLAKWIAQKLEELRRAEQREAEKREAAEVAPASEREHNGSFGH